MPLAGLLYVAVWFCPANFAQNTEASFMPLKTLYFFVINAIYELMLTVCPSVSFAHSGESLLDLSITITFRILYCDLSTKTAEYSDVLYCRLWCSTVHLSYAQCQHVPYTSMVLRLSNRQADRDSATAYRMVTELLSTFAGALLFGLFTAEHRRDEDDESHCGPNSNGSSNSSSTYTPQDQFDVDAAVRILC